MEQKETNTQSEGFFEIADLGFEKEKEILRLLASGRRIKQLAAQYNTYPKAIYRIRDRAMKEFYILKRELPKEVQDYLRHWAFKHNRELIEINPEEAHIEKLKRHQEDLVEATKKVLEKLNLYVIYDDNMLIGEINVQEDDLETIGFFQDQLVIGLLTHLRQDISELAPFSRWEDLRVKDITFKLKNEISMKAARREFGGKCKVCKDWN
jgi:hypothetical protein